MENKEIPTISELITSYDKGEIQPFEGMMLCKVTENNIPSPITYQDIVIHSELNKKEKQEIMWGNYGK